MHPVHVFRKTTESHSEYLCDRTAPLPAENRHAVSLHRPMRLVFESMSELQRGKLLRSPSVHLSKHPHYLCDSPLSSGSHGCLAVTSANTQEPSFPGGRQTATLTHEG